MKRLLRRASVGIALISVAYLVLLAYPQPLFAYELSHAGLTVHSTRPIPAALRLTLERANGRLQRSPLYDVSRASHLFVCDARPLFALFARQNYRAGAVAQWLVGQHVFLRESDLEHDRLIGPSGNPVAADRPLSYFMAHEVMHIAIARHIGRVRYSRLPQWLDDGYADYVARDIDLRGALHKMKADARELDPVRSGLYLRYHLMVAYLLEKQGLTIDRLLANPPDRDAIERELMNLPDWPEPGSPATSR